MNKRKRIDNTADFIELAKQVHCGKFDYSDVKFTGNKGKVIINCKRHGRFEQRADHHLNGSSCRTCAWEHRTELRRQKLHEAFFEKAIAVHENLYDYSKVCYVAANRPVIIVCLVHGDFLQTPDCHFSGSGCVACNGVKLSKEKFIAMAQLCHGAKFDYSDVVYNNIKTHVLIR